jgi:hypothetical protein
MKHDYRLKPVLVCAKRAQLIGASLSGATSVAETFALIELQAHANKTDKIARGRDRLTIGHILLVQFARLRAHSRSAGKN